jgi:hypothetical protein
MGAPLFFHHPGWPQILNFFSFVEGKRFNYIMVKAHINLRLLPTSILDIYKVFEVLVCCLKGIWVHPYIFRPAKLAPDFGLLGPSWSGNVMVEDDIHLRLLPTYILDRYKVFEV